jgi:hypothetical protein
MQIFLQHKIESNFALGAIIEYKTTSCDIGPMSYHHMIHDASASHENNVVELPPAIATASELRASNMKNSYSNSQS